MPINVKTSAINIRTDDGYDNVDALFAGDISNVVVPWLNSHPPYGYATPEMFGAIGDGVNDDTAALQDCIDSNDIIVLTNTYKIQSTLTLHSNLYINGCGKGKIVKDTAVTNYYAALSYYGDSEIENVVIDGLNIIGVQYWTGETTSGERNDIGIRLINSNNIRVLNCNIEECGAIAISISGKNVVIDNNVILYTGEFITTEDHPNYNFGIGYGGEHFKVTRNTISGVIQGIAPGLTNKHCIIAENDISTNGQHGIYMASAEDVEVVNNVIHDCSLCGIKIQIGNPSLEVFEHIVVADNIISRCHDHGIEVVDLIALNILSDVMVTGNFICETNSAIHVTRTNSVMISNNIIKNVTAYGIRISNTSNIIVESNIFVSPNAHAIHFADGTKSMNKNISVKNNSIAYTGTALWLGITVYTGENIFIDGNELTCDASGNTKTGIKINNTSDSIENMYISSNFAKGFATNYSVNYPDGVSLENNHFI